MNDPIYEFRGETRWLSNFEYAHVVYDGIVYPTSEHAYQAAKSLSLSTRMAIARMPKPGDAKRAGGALSLRPDWEQIKLAVMWAVNLDKFTRNMNLGKRLIETTGRPLIEGNDWGDTFWGVCNGEGQNHLGQTLMAVRDLLNELRDMKCTI